MLRQGMIDRAPLASAVTIVVVARNTSIMTQQDPPMVPEWINSGRKKTFVCIEAILWWNLVQAYFGDWNSKMMNIIPNFPLKGYDEYHDYGYKNVPRKNTASSY
jgi:hypothetical protein